MNADPPVTRPQRLLSRAAWFVVGGIIGYGLNVGPFFWLETKAGWPPWVAYAASLGFQTAIFFCWNYWINFRTASDWEACLRRYLMVVAANYAANYTLAQLGFLAFPQFKYLVIAIIPCCLGLVKFWAYHHWVFPAGSRVHPADDLGAQGPTV